MANNAFLFIRPISREYIGKQILEDCDRLLRFLDLGLVRLPLRASIVLVLHLFSSSQTPVDLKSSRERFSDNSGGVSTDS